MTSDTLPSGSHNLIIRSLRPIDIACTCGFTMILVTFQSETDEAITQHIFDCHKAHLNRVRKLQEPPKETP
jgi:hypothetical protein